MRILGYVAKTIIIIDGNSSCVIILHVTSY